MFKGPASLNGASVISTTGNIATTSGGTLSINGTSALTGAVTTTAGLTVGNALTVSAGGANITGNSSFAGSSTLSVGGILTASGGIAIAGAQLTSIDPGTGGGGDNLVIASKLSVTQAIAAAGSETTKQLAAFSSGQAGPAVDLSGVTLTDSRAVFIVNSTARTGNDAQITVASIDTTPADGHTRTVIWGKRAQTSGTPATSVRFDFGSGKLLDSNETAYQYVTLNGLGANAKFLYVVAGNTEKWVLVSSTNATLGDS
jgi:hypothetical protein